jgi:hypothetical protein
MDVTERELNNNQNDAMASVHKSPFFPVRSVLFGYETVTFAIQQPHGSAHIENISADFDVSCHHRDAALSYRQRKTG